VSTNRVSTVVQYGFSITILILFVLGGVGMFELRATYNETSATIHSNNSKVSMAHDMRDAIRQRQISLYKMLSTDDPFKRDEELLHFYELAGDYRNARSKLLSYPKNLLENSLHLQLTEISRLAQPLNRQAAEHIANGDDDQLIRQSVDAAFDEQQKLLSLLNQLVVLQDQNASETVQLGTLEYDKSLLTVLGLGLFFVFLALYIGRRVAKYVEEKNSELLIATKAKSEFLATMSHEIRTPLTAIIGFAEASLDSDQTIQDRILNIKTIIRSGKHLLKIINDVLDLAKIEAKRFEIETLKVSLFEILSDVDTIVKSQAKDKGLSFKIEYEFPLPEIIETDPLRLKQILINLVNNAIKFTDTGQVLAKVAYDAKIGILRFNVVDSGIGMTPEQLNKIFSPFTQADSSTTRKYGGTGLGLSVSKELAKKLGGDLTAQSSIHMGSQFELTISTGKEASRVMFQSVQQLPKLKEEENEKIVSTCRVTAYHGKVLLAEDNPDNQRLLAHLIGKLGPDLDIAENGKIAIDMAAANEYDLVLMDMQMPVMGGLEAVTHLRAYGYKRPIVALTANAMRKDREECFRAGCDDFLTKPIERKELNRIAELFLPPTSEDKINNERITSELLNKEPSLLDLVDKYIESLPDINQQIKHYEQNKDWGNLYAIIHQLKGTGGGMGFPILSEIAGKIQFQLVNENYAALKDLVMQLERIICRIVGNEAMLNYSNKLGRFAVKNAS